jgi:peptidoglycan/xylan/chitin deacetylase (PgdA/CDA1 family)
MYTKLTPGVRQLARMLVVVGLAACANRDPVSPVAHDVTQAVVPSAAIVVGTNLIQNAALESAGSDGISPASWSRQYWGSRVPTFRYPVAGRIGSGASVSLSGRTSGDARWQHALVSVVEQQQYAFTVWYKSSMQSGISIEYVRAGDGARSYGGLATLPSSGGAWVQYSSTITIPSGIGAVSVFQWINRAGTLTIDDASLVALTAAPPPPPPTPTGEFSEGMFSFTFDDAWESEYVNALPMLQAAGFKATFYLTTNGIDQGWNLFMKPWQVQDIAAKGHEIAGHTLLHPDLTAISASEVMTEIGSSRSYLQALTGQAVTSFAYPYGRSNAAVKDLVRQAGYTSARGVSFQERNTAGSDTYDLRSRCFDTAMPTSAIFAQIDAAIANRQWYVLCMHEIKLNGDDLAMPPAQLQQIVDYVRQSGVKVVTVAQGRALMQSP